MHRPGTSVKGEVEAPGVRSATGLPATLKSGVETLSGLMMDSVKVHHGSPKPFLLGASAYTQGTDIHIGPGQEKHLPHEAWHVVQQMQGRVGSTAIRNGLSINDDPKLEREAEAMSRKVAQASLAHQGVPAGAASNGRLPPRGSLESPSTPIGGAPVAQLYSEGKYTAYEVVDLVWDARTSDGNNTHARLNHNYAVQVDNPNNYVRSKSNSHGEVTVASRFLASRGNNEELMIISERQPCGPCEGDMRELEALADPPLEINVGYFIDYTKGEGKRPLEVFYEEHGKLEPEVMMDLDPSSSSEDEGSDEDYRDH